MHGHSQVFIAVPCSLGTLHLGLLAGLLSGDGFQTAPVGPRAGAWLNSNLTATNDLQTSITHIRNKGLQGAERLLLAASGFFLRMEFAPSTLSRHRRLRRLPTSSRRHRSNDCLIMQVQCSLSLNPHRY